MKSDLTADEAWALREALDKGFFSPGTHSGADLAISLARRDLLRESDRDPIWFPTQAGREAIADGLSRVPER
jgi:hypothetical protein